MTQRVLTADIIAKEAIMILENNCVMGNLVYRGYEEEFPTASTATRRAKPSRSAGRPTSPCVPARSPRFRKSSKARPRSPSTPRKAWTSSSPRPT
jgi:hypothetical protein